MIDSSSTVLDSSSGVLDSSSSVLDSSSSVSCKNERLILTTTDYKSIAKNLLIDEFSGKFTSFNKTLLLQLFIRSGELIKPRDNYNIIAIELVCDILMNNSLNINIPYKDYLNRRLLNDKDNLATFLTKRDTVMEMVNKMDTMMENAIGDQYIVA